MKEVLWVSVGQRAAELPAIKVGGQKKILPNGPARAKRVRTSYVDTISAQESSSTFKVSYLFSKYPHFNSVI